MFYRPRRPAAKVQKIREMHETGLRTAEIARHVSWVVIVSEASFTRWSRAGAPLAAKYSAMRRPLVQVSTITTSLSGPIRHLLDTSQAKIQEIQALERQLQVRMCPLLCEHSTLTGGWLLLSMLKLPMP